MKKFLNIGIVCYPTYGGSGVVATELGKELAKKGHSVHFISYDQPARLDAFTNNVFYHEVSTSKYPLFKYAPYETALTGKIIDIVKFHNLDLLHVHYAIPHAAAAVYAKLILKQERIYIPVITTLHGTDITLIGKDAAYEPVVSFSINQSDGVTTVSQALKKETFDHFKIYNDIEVIPNFIDLKKYQRMETGLLKNKFCENNERLIIHISNFRKVKRVEDVVHIFNKIQEKIPAQLIMVGDGPERQNTEMLCRSLGICSKVHYLGKQEAIEKILSECDLFLMPSETESFGLAALEAMACGVPVVSSNTGGLMELNLNGISGFTCSVGNVEAMANKSLEILANEDNLTLFRNGALKVAQGYSEERIIPLYENFYMNHLQYEEA